MPKTAKSRIRERLYLEIGPLKEGNYTGISQVTAAIADQMLGDAARETAFFYGRMVVDKPAVEDLLTRRNGDVLEWYLQRTDIVPAPPDLSHRNVALFPNRKTCRRGFDREYQIVHDLSTLLTPQFHERDTIDYHAGSLEEDMRSNDVTFCVSEATRSDVLTYFPELDADKVVSLPLAVSIPPEDQGRFAGRTVEPYVLVLGTIEPRKNVAQILHYIRNNRDVLRQCRFVFLGRHGWGETVDALVARYDLTEEMERGRITFPGFVPESTKTALLEAAVLVIYPSLFEGFGLPVLEALSVGVPCIATRTSSVPEVGGDCCYYFDPFTDEDFDRAFVRAIVDTRLRRDEIARNCRARAAEFSWSKTYARLTAVIDAEGEGAGAAQPKVKAAEPRQTASKVVRSTRSAEKQTAVRGTRKTKVRADAGND
jgi:glycosyltransferase involved in cell wall biosynthesis